MRRRRHRWRPAIAPFSTAMAWSRPITSSARCSAFRGFGSWSRSTTRGRINGGFPDGGTLLLRGGGLGTRGRYHPSYATTLRISKLNFGELRKAEVRRITLLGTWVNKGRSPPGNIRYVQG